MSLKTELESNNIDLQSILDMINALPEADTATVNEVKGYLELDNSSV